LTATSGCIEHPPESSRKLCQESSQRIAVQLHGDVNAIADWRRAIALNGAQHRRFALVLVARGARGRASLASNDIGDGAAERPEPRTNEDAAEPGLKGKPPNPSLLGAFQTEACVMPSTQERSDLDLQSDQERRDQRIGDVGHQVGQQQIQAERQANQHAQQKVKAVHRQAANEQAERDGQRDACG